MAEDGRQGRHWWSVAPAPDGTTPISTRRAYTEVLGLWAAFFAASIVAAGFSLDGRDVDSTVHGWSQATPSTVNQFATIALCIAVPVLLTSRRRPHPARLGIDRGGVGAGQWVRITAWAIAAFTVGSIVTSALATGSYDQGRFSYPSLLLNVAHGLQAGPLEEIVVLAFLVSTLEQARRPRREIVVVALVLRCSYHIYYGPGVFGILVWASVFLWLYFRFRTVLPLIVLHSFWDTAIFLGHHWNGVLIPVFLLYVGLLIAAPITWLVERSNRPRPPPVWAPYGPPWTGGPPGPPGPPGSAWPPPSPPPSPPWGAPAPPGAGPG